MAGTANSYYNSLPPDYSREQEQWLEHWSTRQDALEIVLAFRELEREWEEQWGDAPFGIGDLEDYFNLTKNEIKTGKVQRHAGRI